MEFSEFDIAVCNRIKTLIEDIYKTTHYAFAIKCCLKESVVRGIVDCTVKPKPEYIDDILNALPEIHKTWLCLGSEPIITKRKKLQIIPAIESKETRTVAKPLIIRDNGKNRSL